MTHSNNTGFWIHDSTTVGDETFWPQYIILTQSGPLTHTCLRGANVSLDKLLEGKQRNRQKDSADLYPLRSAPLVPSNFSPLLSSPTPFNLPIISSSSHFPFLLASFSFPPHHLPFHSMPSVPTPLHWPHPPTEQFNTNMATTLEAPTPLPPPARSLRFSCFLLDPSSYPSLSGRTNKREMEW